MRTRDLTIGEHRVRVNDVGRRDGTPCVVLVHGIGASSRYYGPLARELAPAARVVALDLPGFGASSRPRETLDMSDLARVVGEVMHQMEVAQPVLVGHSMGCQVVTALDAQDPGRVRGLVLIGPTVDPARRGYAQHFLKLSYNSMFEPWRVNRTLLRDYLRCGVRQYLKTLRPMLADHIEPRLARTSTRTVVVRGSRDRVARRDWAVEASRLLRNGDLVELPGAAHGVHMVRTREVARACLALLDA